MDSQTGKPSRCPMLVTMALGRDQDVSDEFGSAAIISHYEKKTNGQYRERKN